MGGGGLEQLLMKWMDTGGQREARERALGGRRGRGHTHCRGQRHSAAIGTK